MSIFMFFKKWMNHVKKKTNKRYPLKFGSKSTISFKRRFAVREEEISTTDLHAAIALGEYTIVSHLLILPNVDLSIPGQDGKTPLQTAIEYGRVEIVKLLLKMPTVNPHGVVDAFDRTPLHIACWKGHEAIVEFLLATRPKQKAMYIPSNNDIKLKQQLDDSSFKNYKELELKDQDNLNKTNMSKIEIHLQTKTSSTTLIGQQLFERETNIDSTSNE